MSEAEVDVLIAAAESQATERTVLLALDEEVLSEIVSLLGDQK